MKEAHRKSGHCNKDAVRATAKALGIELIPSTLGACEPCMEAKAKCKNPPKKIEHEEAALDGCQVFADMSKIRNKNG